MMAGGSMIYFKLTVISEKPISTDSKLCDKSYRIRKLIIADLYSKVIEIESYSVKRSNMCIGLVYMC